LLGRQAKILSAAQAKAVLGHLERTRHPLRNRLIFLLSLRAGLRAKEIASLTWAMVTDPEGQIADTIHLRDEAAKGRSGGVVPMARDLMDAMRAYRGSLAHPQPSQRVIRTERSAATSAQAVINMFSGWYASLGFEGCSSHSGRRTFITNAARNIGRVGGSLRDVQALARHGSLSTTQRYIEVSGDAMRKVVEITS
jgi:integrase/recombinase XerD